MTVRASPRDPLLAALLEALVLPREGAEPPALLVQAAGAGAAVALRDSQDLLLLLACPGPLPDHAALSARAAALLAGERPEVLEGTKPASLWVAAVGGPEPEPAWLEAPAQVVEQLGRRLVRLHVAGDGTVRGPPCPSREALVEASALALPRLAAPAPDLRARLREAEQEGERTLGEEGRYAREQQRSGGLTLALLAAQALVFACELAWGGSDFTLTLLRMGGNAAWQGPWAEPWRLLAAGFLHAGPVHLLSNLCALLLLGNLLEPLVGRWRLLVLFAAGIAGGNLATALARKDLVAVGCSGGLFALTAGLLALAARRRGALPPLSRKELRTFALVFLGFNLIGSFTPGVDWRAHLAGAATGGLLAGSGLLTLGLRPAWSGEAERPAWRWAWRLAGGAAGLACVGALALAWSSGRPWRLMFAPALVPVALAGTDLSIAVPADVAPARSVATHGEWREHLFGDGDRDPVLVAASVRPLEEPVLPERRAAALEEMKRLLEAEPDAAKPLRAPARLEVIDGRPVLVLEQHRGEVELPRWLFIEGGWVVDLELSLAPGLPGRWARLAPRIAASVRARP